MNFKETYKNANTYIKADRALINTIYEKAEKAEKSKKTKVINYSVFGSFAAAAAVFVLVFNTVNFNTGKVKGIDTQIATNNIKQAEQENILSNEKTNTPIEKEKADEQYTYTQTYTETEKTDTTAQSSIEDTAIPETDAPLTDSTAQAENIEQKFAPNMAKMASGGGGGSAQAESGMITASLDSPEADNGLSFKFYTPDEYYSYIGINPIAAAKIPSDMAFNEFYGADIASDENGNITFDTATFTAYNSTMEKNITIEATKLATDKHTTLFVDDDSFKITQLSAGGCNFIITAFNISAEEFEILVASLEQK